jgi:hypothetical protein
MSESNPPDEAPTARANCDQMLAETRNTTAVVVAGGVVGSLGVRLLTGH